jgi:hypothetical protein
MRGNAVRAMGEHRRLLETSSFGPAVFTGFPEDMLPAEHILGAPPKQMVTLFRNCSGS